MPELLLAVAQDRHAGSVGWLVPRSKELADEVEAGLRAVEKAGGVQGDGKQAVLKELLGRLRTCGVLAARGCLVVMEQLDDLLPKLTSSAKGGTNRK